MGCKLEIDRSCVGEVIFNPCSFFKIGLELNYLNNPFTWKMEVEHALLAALFVNT